MQKAAELVVRRTGRAADVRGSALCDRQRRLWRIEAGGRLWSSLHVSYYPPGGADSGLIMSASQVTL